MMKKKKIGTRVDLKFSRRLHDTKVDYISYLRYKTEQRKPLRDKVFQSRRGKNLVEQFNVLNAQMEYKPIMNKDQIDYMAERDVKNNVHILAGKYNCRDYSEIIKIKNKRHQVRDYVESLERDLRDQKVEKLWKRVQKRELNKKVADLKKKVENNFQFRIEEIIRGRILGDIEESAFEYYSKTRMKEELTKHMQPKKIRRKGKYRRRRFRYKKQDIGKFIKNKNNEKTDKILFEKEIMRNASLNSFKELNQIKLVDDLKRLLTDRCELNNSLRDGDFLENYKISFKKIKSDEEGENVDGGEGQKGEGKEEEKEIGDKEKGEEGKKEGGNEELKTPVGEKREVNEIRIQPIRLSALKTPAKIPERSSWNSRKVDMALFEMIEESNKKEKEQKNMSQVQKELKKIKKMVKLKKSVKEIFDSSHKKLRVIDYVKSKVSESLRNSSRKIRPKSSKKSRVNQNTSRTRITRFDCIETQSSQYISRPMTANPKKSNFHHNSGYLLSRGKSAKAKKRKIKVQNKKFKKKVKKIMYKCNRAKRSLRPKTATRIKRKMDKSFNKIKRNYLDKKDYLMMMLEQEMEFDADETDPEKIKMKADKLLNFIERNTFHKKFVKFLIQRIPDQYQFILNDHLSKVTREDKNFIKNKLSDGEKEEAKRI